MRAGKSWTVHYDFPVLEHGTGFFVNGSRNPAHSPQYKPEEIFVIGMCPVITSMIAGFLVWNLSM